MSKGRLSSLHKRATEFCNDRALHRRIHFLYRNKPHQYFDKIRSQNRGEMKRYMKNDGGDQASPLNRAIPGLFFSAFYLKNCDGQLIPRLLLLEIKDFTWLCHFFSILKIICILQTFTVIIQIIM